MPPVTPQPPAISSDGRSATRGTRQDPTLSLGQPMLDQNIMEAIYEMKTTGDRGKRKFPLPSDLNSSFHTAWDATTNLKPI